MAAFNAQSFYPATCAQKTPFIFNLKKKVAQHFPSLLWRTKTDNTPLARSPHFHVRLFHACKLVSFAPTLRLLSHDPSYIFIPSTWISALGFQLFIFWLRRQQTAYLITINLTAYIPTLIYSTNFYNYRISIYLLQRRDYYLR